MAFSLFSKPSGKPKGADASPKTPGVALRSANDSNRQDLDRRQGAPKAEKGNTNNSSVLLTMSRDWRPGQCDIEVAESPTSLCSALENAALLYANGQTESARQMLSEAIVQDREAKSSLLVWLALFDLLQRLGAKAAADDLALKFVVAFERSPPVWDERRNPADATAEAKSKGSVFVRFTGELATDNPSLQSFIKASSTSAKCRVDFSGINALEEDACRALGELLRNLRRKDYPLQLQGADVLRTQLEATVRIGEAFGEGYWSLLLELLQWMKDSAVFEEQAVNYAISFEVSPPSWEGLTSQQAQQAACAIEADSPIQPDQHDSYPLQGTLTGPGDPQVLRVREFAKENEVIIFDFAGVQRIDFICAGSLLNELEIIERAKKPIQIIGASPIVQALLLVIGIKPRYFHPRLL